MGKFEINGRIKFTTPGLGEYISGVILYDETIHQQQRNGIPFIKAIIGAGIIPGIKVDIGAKDMAGHVASLRIQNSKFKIQN
ncbi:MAG: class I fructose-bisphosphate aldolase [Nostoc sp.]|uniref:class I fructose-bisphosphate aldolase n=1 Tax=Nostoc sp. TaxID=1180 RepID=UPI002FF48559